ncbi:hypothetical protein OROGR_031522 [Orobanche gracilis]
MSSLFFLELRYQLSKQKFPKKPSRTFVRERQNSVGYPSHLSNIEELKHVFNKFDSNNDGKISPKEYRAIILKIFGKGNLTKEVKKIFEVADLDGDGFIDFHEFVEVQKMGDGVKTDDLHRAFQAFDKNNDGKITVDEVWKLLTKLGESCSLRDCQEMVRAVDSNGDGVIDMDEFIALMARTMIIH